MRNTFDILDPEGLNRRREKPGRGITPEVASILVAIQHALRDFEEPTPQPLPTWYDRSDLSRPSQHQSEWRNGALAQQLEPESRELEPEEQSQPFQITRDMREQLALVSQGE